MTDKELLELAAKAAGKDLTNWEFQAPIDGTEWTKKAGITFSWGMQKPPHGPGDYECWNPLTDDGDAFRSAVKLQLEVYHANDEGDAVYVGYYLPENTGMKYCIEYYDDITHMGDANSATRRAIVRAAAEIGKTL